MKKVLTVVIFCLVLTLGAGSVLAEAPRLDFDSLTKEQLEAIVMMAQAALQKFEQPVEEQKVLLDEQGMKVTLTGMRIINEHHMAFDVIIENNSDKPMGVSQDKLYVNGWELSGSGSGEILPGKKAKQGWGLHDIATAEVKEVSDIKEMEFILQVYDPASWDTIFETDTIHLSF